LVALAFLIVLSPSWQLAQASPIDAQADRATRPNSLDGTWEGTLQVRTSGHIEGQAPLLVRIRISGDVAQVFSSNGLASGEEMPGKFKVERRLSDTVVYANPNVKNRDDSFSEAWRFDLSRVNDLATHVVYSRLVTNYKLPLGNKFHKFSQSAAGTLVRVPG
jgi:hypothetical protein